MVRNESSSRLNILGALVDISADERNSFKADD
jgi:hypothetical protein